MSSIQKASSTEARLPPGNPTITKEVTIVIPCFNEAETMGFLAEKLREMEAEAPANVDFRYLLVDDGSQDRTWELMHEHFGHLPEFKMLKHDKNSGIMAALKTGIRAAETEWVATIDADCTFDPVALLDLIVKCRGWVPLSSTRRRGVCSCLAIRTVKRGQLDLHPPDEDSPLFLYQLLSRIPAGLSGIGPG